MSYFFCKSNILRIPPNKRPHACSGENFVVYFTVCVQDYFTVCVQDGDGAIYFFV